MITTQPDFGGPEIRGRIKEALEPLSGASQRILLESLQKDSVVSGPTLEGLVAAEETTSPDQLAIDLIPVAAMYASVPISGYRVGAVVQFETEDEQRGLALGANIELEHTALPLTVHAEQAAVVNAALHGARSILKLAVSSPPCGHCRQFLMEFAERDGLEVIIVAGEQAVTRTSLERLLPLPFGPEMLGVSPALPNLSRGARSLTFEDGPGEDELLTRAADAAACSYSPYTDAAAGCAFEAASGAVTTGTYIENAAFNPSLSPAHTALVARQMGEWIQRDDPFRRAVLVEVRGHASQREIVRQVLHAVAPDVDLEYREVVPRNPSG